MPSGWSGHPTGRIPLSMMTQLRDDIGASGYAQPDAARAFLAMSREFEAKFGYPLPFSEFYRTYERQDYYYQGWLQHLPGFNPAAPPWAGKHEEALAVDLAWPFTSWTTPQQAWFRQNEARFGFSSAQGIADGEPWHKVYIGPTPTTAGGGAVIIEQSEEDILSELSQSTRDFITATVRDQVNALLNDPKTGAIPLAVATLTTRLQREARGRLFFCPNPPEGLPRFVIIFQQRDPGEQNLLYIWPQDGLTDEQRVTNLGAYYGQTADTVAQAKAVPDTPDQYRTRIGLALGTDTTFTNPAK